MRLTQHGRLASSTLLFEPGNNNAPNDGKEPDNDKHQSHWRHDEREARSYHHKSDSGCQWIHRPPTFRVRRFLGLMRLLPHDGGGLSEFLLAFRVCLPDQAAYFTREPFYLLFSFLLI